MFYKLFSNQQEELKSMPETGMGYQLIEARFAGEYTSKEFIMKMIKELIKKIIAYCQVHILLQR